MSAVLVIRGESSLQLAAFVPPLAFLVVVSVARAIVGVERIVFYQVAATGVLAGPRCGRDTSSSRGSSPASRTSSSARGRGRDLALTRGREPPPADFGYCRGSVSAKPYLGPPPLAQDRAVAQAPWPGKRTAVTPTREPPLWPGKRSRSQALRPPAAKRSAAGPRPRPEARAGEGPDHGL
ncbi:MAG TPA: hypothetical protein VNO30_36870 [Kofleriaceae bacterium]|nr:hypothetical protein [Kofleriaceae bacterium]